MALKLKYRNSFIDAEDEMPEKPPARANSLPPRVSQAPEVEEAWKDEVNLKMYVDGLSEELQTKTWGIQSPSMTTVDTDAGTDTASTPTSVPSVSSTASLSFVEASCSPGSVGHPELCRRQCIYFMSGPSNFGMF